MTVAVAHQASATGRVALQQAVQEARVRTTDLAVLHVVDSLDPDTAEAYRLGVSDEIERIVGHADVSWNLHLTTPNESVAQTILELCEEVRADLLVIGARRRSPVGKALLGSVAQTVILGADVAVLVVKT